MTTTTVTVKTQAELDQALAAKTPTIYIDSPAGVWLRVDSSGSSSVVAWDSSSVVAWDSSSVVARDSSSVVAWGSSSVVAWDSSSVVAWDSSSVEARDSSSVEAWDSSSVVARDSSSVEARDSSSVEARDSSSVVARDSSSVVARDSSSVVAWDSSSVVAWDSSSVVAWDSSSVVARDSSSVEAWDSSSVEARDSSSVEAGKYVAVHLHSQRVTLTGEGHVIDITAIDFNDPAVWCEFHGVEVVDGIAYLYKAVNQQWTTPRGTDYSPGSTPEAPDWDATWRDCGKGLHFCDHPTRSLDFLGGYARDARFLKVGVRLDEMVTLGDKVKARRVVVACVEVDRHGKPVPVGAVA